MKKPHPLTHDELLTQHALLQGTMSRVHGILRLQGENFLERWEAIDKFCYLHPNGVRVIDIDSDKDLMHK